MTNYNLPSDDFLYEKYRKAKKGLSSWKKLMKNIGASRRDLIVFQPDGESDDAIYSLTCLNQLILTNDPLSVKFITTNSDMKDYVNLFTNKANVTVIDQKTSDEIMNYALMTIFEPNFYIASLSDPYGRWGDRMIYQKMVGAEHCFAIGIYRVWNYKPEDLPVYSGNEKRIIDFLKRAKNLQKRSIEIDQEAINRK